MIERLWPTAHSRERASWRRFGEEGRPGRPDLDFDLYQRFGGGGEDMRSACFKMVSVAVTTNNSIVVAFRRGMCV
jgi:hypothetical protein